jgi:hypothetical protein
VFVQTKAKCLIQRYPWQQARLKEFASLFLSLSLSLFRYFYPFINIGRQLLNCSAKKGKVFSSLSRTSTPCFLI